MSETISDLYFKLGLDLNDLNSDFVDAEKSISENMRRLNREKYLIQLRAQIDLNNLEEAANSVNGMRIQQEALTKQIELQQNRVQILNLAYEDMAATQGESALSTQRLILELERERLSLSKLEKQLRDTSEQQKIALGVSFEILALIEPVMKGLDRIAASGIALPPYAKTISGIVVGLAAIIQGSKEATEELRKENPSKILSEEFERSQTIMDSSLNEIYQSTARTNKKIIDETRKLSNAMAYQKFSPASPYEEYLNYFKDFLRLEYILTAETDSFAQSIQQVNSQMPYMKTELGEYAAMAIGVGKTLQGLHKSIVNFTRPAIEGYRSLKLTSDELNLSLNKTIDLVNIANVAGVDFADIRDWIRGVQDAILKGDSADSEVIALTKYGVVIQDTLGNLLDFKTTHDRLVEGYLKAAEAGEGEAYAIMTQGEAIKDILPYLKRYQEAVKGVSKIQWSTTDAAGLAQASRNLQLTQIQTGELKNAISTLGVPLANFTMEAAFEEFKTLTKIVEENRDTILYWEFVVIEAMKQIENVGGETLNALKKAFTDTNETSDNFYSSILDNHPIGKILNLANSLLGITDKLNDFVNPERLVNEITAEINSRVESATEAINAGINSLDNLIGFTEKLNSVTSAIDEINRRGDALKELLGIKDEIFKTTESESIFDKAQKDLEDYIKANKRAAEETEKTEEAILEGLSASEKRVSQYEKELAGIKIGVQFEDNEYQKSLANLGIWYQEALKDARYYAKEREVIEKLHTAKLEQIENERANRLAEIRDSVNSQGKNETERRLIEIEREKQAWLKAGMSIAEATDLASVKIKNLYQERSNKLNEIRQSQSALERTDLENTIANIEKEKSEWIKAGMEIAEATELAQKRIAKAYDEQEKRLDEIREKVLSLNRTDLENKIIEIDRQRDSWVDIGMEESEAENLARQLKIDAATKLEQEFSEQMNSLYQSDLEQQLARIDKERQAWIQKGIDETRAAELAENQKTKAISEAEKNLDNLMEERAQLYEEYRRNVEETAFAIQSVWDSELNNQLRRIEQERKAWIQKGVDEVTATKWAEQQKVDIQRNAAMEILKNQLKEYRAFQKGGYEGLRQYQLQQLYKTGISPEDLQMTPQQLTNFKFAQKAVQNSLLPNFMSEEDSRRKYYASTKQYSNFELRNVDFSMPIEMVKRLETLNNQIVELSKSINNAKAPSLQTIQPQINVTVQIEEAHAWDYSHIQELADKVADKIAPEIVSALGGDSNSY